uniref:Putative cytochrome P450 n=1 Tax=Helianthus annuus TaxID=4232 RepID=A0A251VEE8_HELAN
MLLTLQAILFPYLSCILALLLFNTIFSSSKSRNNLPPSPPKLPLIGNLHQLGSSPHRALQAMAQSYGPLMMIHLGTVPKLVASSVNAAKEIMKTHDLIFSNRPQKKIPNKLFYDAKTLLFQLWRVLEAEMSLMMEKIQRANGSAINLSEFLISLTNNVVCKVALGRTYEDREFKYLLERTMELLGSFSVGSYISSLKWVDRLSGLERKADKVANEFDEFLESVIDEHVNNKDVKVEGKDLVDILLEFQREDVKGFRLQRDMIKAIIMDIFTGGTDTTFTSLEWAIGELLTHPRAMKELQQEALEICWD